MRIPGAALVVALAWLSSCSFKSEPRHENDPPPPSSGSGGSSGGHAPPTGTAGSAGSSGQPAMDAAVGDTAIPGRGDGGLGDGGDFGQKPKPDEQMPPNQNGGLKCADVFCPFATAPIEPCCTSAEDVEKGAARAEERCGLNFAATGSDFYGELCWQRDQPGVVDETCPAVSVDLRSQEAGCCTDQGRCGSVDGEHGLGCHLDPLATETKACGSDPVDPQEPECETTGQYALRMEVDMAWGGRSGGLWDLTDDGRGKLVLDLLIDIGEVDPDTLELRGTAYPCGVRLPPFYSSTLCEAYQPIYPEAVWESAKMPDFPITGRLQCQHAGCIATIDAQTVLLGIDLPNPEAPWPTSSQTADIECDAGEGAACFPDQDNDGRPGITVLIEKMGTLRDGNGCRSSGYTKRGTPLSSSIAAIFGGIRRADRLWLGARMKVGGSVTFGEECSSGKGSGIAEFVNSRAWGCMVQPGTYNYPSMDRAGANEPCTSQQASFLDANLPLYEILIAGEKPPSGLDLVDESASRGPLVSMVRIGASGAALDCRAVRGAMHP